MSEKKLKIISPVFIQSHISPTNQPPQLQPVPKVLKVPNVPKMPRVEKTTATAKQQPVAASAQAQR